MRTSPTAADFKKRHQLQLARAGFGPSRQWQSSSFYVAMFYLALIGASSVVIAQPPTLLEVVATPVAAVAPAEQQAAYDGSDSLPLFHSDEELSLRSAYLTKHGVTLSTKPRTAMLAAPIAAPEPQPLPVVQQPTLAVTPKPVAVATKKEPVTEPSAHVTIEVTGPAWIEVKHGQRELIYGLKQAGFSQQIALHRALTVRAGNTQNIRFRLNGKTYSYAQLLSKPKPNIQVYASLN